MSAKEAPEIAAQIARLEKMKGGSMKPELRKWLLQRINILKQF
jgi:protein disulfide-isomerase A6